MYRIVEDDAELLDARFELVSIEGTKAFLKWPFKEQAGPVYPDGTKKKEDESGRTIDEIFIDQLR